MINLFGLRRRWLPLVGAVVAVAVLVGVAVLTGLLGGQPNVSRHDHEHGPLSFHRGGGLKSLYSRGEDRWWGSFGAYLPCLREADSEPIDITAVTISTGNPVPRQVRAVFRRLPPVAERDASVPAVGWSLVGSSHGRHPAFGKPGRKGGTFSLDLPQRVTQPCDVLATPAMDDQEILEMLVEMESDGHGAYVRHLRVDYEVGGDKHSVLVKTALILCGSEIQSGFRDPHLAEGDNPCSGS